MRRTSVLSPQVYGSTYMTDKENNLYLRLPLGLLQLVFLFLLSHHLNFSTIVPERNFVLLGLLVVPLVVLALPQARFGGTWSVFLMVGGNAGALVHETIVAKAIEPWLAMGYIVVMLIASFSPSVVQLLGLGGIVCAVYIGSVYEYGSVTSEDVVLIPVLLALVLVLAKKAALMQEQAQKGAETEDKIRTESMNDALTGLPNRAQFIGRVWRAIQCAQNNDAFMFAVLFVDLDGFKPVNDGLGHKAGDAVLIETARRLQSCLRKGDVVARYGGDEFTLLVNSVTGKADAVRVAERVLRKVTEPILVKQRVQIGASIGIALSTNIHHRPEDLIRDADIAMYRAKSEGKGRYEISDQLRDASLAAPMREKLG